MVNSRKTVKSVVSNHSEGDIMTGSLQIKNDKFYMIINLKENGKRKQKWISTGLEVKGNKRKAEQMLREFLTSQEHVQSKPKSSVLFSDYIRHWLTIAERRVDSVTFQGYRLMANAQVIPYFENTAVRLGDVDRESLQRFSMKKQAQAAKMEKADCPLLLCVSTKTS